MDNGAIPNQTQTPSSTINELSKKTKGSTKPTSNQIDESKQNSNTSFQLNNVALPSSSEQNSPNSTSSVSIPVNKPAVVPQSVVEAIINQGFPAFAKTTKPIPASVFSYRFASPTNNQTPYYISSDIVLSGGIAQQTRRRIVHNEVERRRKDKINGWITKLAEVIPGCSHGKQSKNLVLERAVEYFSEVNSRVTQLEECQQHNNSLVLDNQALKQRLEVLQKQNNVLQELLEKNNVQIPKTQTCATQTNTQSNPSVVITNEQTQKLPGPSLVSDNTNVTWMAPGKIPMTTSSRSVIGATEMNQSFSQSPSLAGSDICSVQQPQTNYSLYSVSSIMNELPQGVVSLVDGNITQETNPVKLAITVDSTAVNNNDNIVSASIPIAVKNKLDTKTLAPMCIPEVGGLISSQNRTVQEPGAQESSSVATMYLAGEGIIPQSRGSSTTQGMTQVVLCQTPKVSKSDSSCSHRPTSISVCKERLLAPVVTHTPNVINLAHQTAPVVSNNSIIIQTQGPILSLGTPITSSIPSAVSSSLTTPLYCNSLQNINSTNAYQNGTLLQPQGVVSLNNYMATIPSVVTTINNPVNQGVFPMTFGQGAPISTNNVCTLASNVLQQGVVTLNTNPTPRVNSIPLAPQVLSQTDPKSNQLVTGKLTSGLVTLNVLPKPVGVVTGTPNKILHQQAQNLVTLNVPQTALQVTTCPLSGTKTSCGNSMAISTNSSINLTPSPRTAFVIVRSTQPQQTLHYTVPSQAVSQINYNLEVGNVTTNCATLMSTRTTPSTVVQPAFFQLQTPFPFNTTSSPTSVINTTTSVQSIQRSYSSLSKSTSTLASSQPPAKLPKRNGNTKKRQLSRSSENSKSKHTKLSKSSQGSISTLTSSLTNTSTNSQVLRADGNKSAEPRNSNAMDICQHEDMLSIQNFSISSLIPSIDSQTPASGRPISPRNTRINSELARTSGVSTTQAKTSQSSSNSQRLSHSIDSLTRRNNVTAQVQNQNTIQQQQQQQRQQQQRQQQQQQQQQQPQQQRQQQQQQPQQQQQQQQQQSQQQQQTQSNLLSFSAESLLGSGDELVPNIQPITCGATNNFNTQNTFTISTFQESASDGSMNQNFSNFSAEALISASDFIGISNEPQSSRSNFTQEAQSGKQPHNRTQMFSDFSAESLINSTDLNSGLSYAIDNLISRSDNNDNGIAMASVNPNLLHTATSSILPDNINQSMYSTSIPVTSMLKTSMYPHNTAMPVTPILKNHLTSTADYQNATNGTDQTSYCTMNLTPFSKYGFSSPQKQQKEIFSYKHNTLTFSYPSSSVTTSPTFLKHSVDSITSSQHNSVSSTTGAFAFNSPLANTVACPTLNSLHFDQINSHQFPVSSNSYSNNLNRNFQGPTMGSFA